MLNDPVKDKNSLLHVRIVAHDRDILTRVSAALEKTSLYHVERRCSYLNEISSELRRDPPTSLLLVTLGAGSSDVQALQQILQSGSAPQAVIVIADGVSEQDARSLFRLQVADWLGQDCSAEDITKACSAVLQPKTAPEQAKCTTFVSATGGAGASTLALGCLDNFLTANKRTSAKACVVDLNFQSGIIADYLDLEPGLDVDEIANSPERMDWRLIEVMLAKHKKGFSVLAAPSTFKVSEQMSPEIVGRLLDILAVQFDHLIIDLPSIPTQYSEIVLRGSDQCLIVTPMTITGLRQARRMADLFNEAYDIETNGSIIVNKIKFGTSAGVGKRQVKEIIGQGLAGFVPEIGRLSLEAQNRGVLLSALRRKDPLRNALRKIT